MEGTEATTATEAAPPTQVARPWRAVVRTVFQMGVGLAVMVPLIYSAATQHDPDTATGWVGLALVISGAVTRVMALPIVNDYIGRWLPWLAARPEPRGRDDD